MSDLTIKQGIWFHETKGIAIVEIGKDGCISIDKNIIKNHPVFRTKIHVVETLTGEYFFNKSLKGYEFIDSFNTEELKERKNE